MIDKSNMWNLLKGEWEKIPQGTRYIIEIGCFLIFNVWVLDHWKPSQGLPYLFLGYFDIRFLFYNIGQVLILVGVMFVIFKVLVNLPKSVSNYKSIYPIKNIGKKFDLIWFKGKLMLFDHNKKKYYHVYPWETAEDLNFVSYGTHLDYEFSVSNLHKVKLENNKTLDINSYENGGSINTTR